MKELTLVQAATIAGLIQAPSRFDPYRNYEAARNPRLVLCGCSPTTTSPRKSTTTPCSSPSRSSPTSHCWRSATRRPTSSRT
ncbi:MAG: hypothetical protein R2695_22130 [Acidimicrobiales bacterium]